MIRIVFVEPAEDYQLKVRLSDGRQGLFDMKPYLNMGVFHELKDQAYFRKVTVAYGGIAWPNEQDLSPETIECGMRQEALSVK